MHRSVLLGLLALTASVLAADFWKDKPYSQWTDDEVSKLLSDSPWAESTKATQQSTGQSSGMGRRGGMGRGGGMGWPGGGGMGGGRRGGDGGQQMPAIAVTVRWQTALPVREALLKQTGPVKADETQTASSLTAPTPGYVLAVLGLPETMPSRPGRYQRSDDDDSGNRDNRDADAGRLDRMKSTTYISRKDRASIFPEKVDRDKDGVTILFTFPRSTPISLDEKEVEFVTRYGALEIKRKFKLKEMVYQGKLEL